MEKEIVLTDALSRLEVRSRAPTRIDCGGGIDHRLISVLCHKEQLQTFNIAIRLYSKIRLKPYRKGFILVNAKKFGKKEAKSSSPSFKDRLALIFAIISFFRVSGVEVKIETDYPLVSGLGGSGSLSIALIGALIKALELAGQKISFTSKEIIWLAHTIEDSLYHNTGLQDQASAYHGGINLWRWQYPNHGFLFSRQSLGIDNRQIEEHACLVYSGKPHYPSHKGSRFVSAFINNPQRGSLVEEINENTKFFVKSLMSKNWGDAARALDKEEYLRRRFLSFTLEKEIMQLIKKARALGCGIKFAGGGGGGCLWAVGPEDSVSRFKGICQNHGQLLPLKVDREGLVVKVNNNVIAEKN